jgi:hypothetical protein
VDETVYGGPDLRCKRFVADGVSEAGRAAPRPDPGRGLGRGGWPEGEINVWERPERPKPLMPHRDRGRAVGEQSRRWKRRFDNYSDDELRLPDGH